MRKITETELLTGMHELLLRLSGWLLMKKMPMSRNVTGLLAQLEKTRYPTCGCLSGNHYDPKQHLWEFLQKQGFLRTPVELYGEMELLCPLYQFFDRALCYAAKGYEDKQRQPSSNRKELHKQEQELNLLQCREYHVHLRALFV